MGLLERALSVEQVSKEGKESPSSLLKRASILRKQAEESPEKKKKAFSVEPSPISDRISPEHAAREVLKDLSLLKESYEAPAQWFQTLKNHLKIRKGALLLPDSSAGVLSPWAITGYDRTTYFRLRIPTSYVYNLFHRSPSVIVRLSKENALDLEPHFSSREFGLIDTLLIYGIFFQEKLIGALIVSDSPLITWEPQVLGLFFTVIDELSASLLYAFRSHRQEKLKSRVFFDLQTFNKALPSDREEKALLVTLDPRPLVQAFRADNPELDTFLMIRDIASFLSSILDGAPVLIHSEPITLYVLHMDTHTDGELLIHQLESSLKHLFPELSTLPSLGMRVTLVQLPLSL